MPWVPAFDLVAQIGKTKGLDGQLVAQETGRLSILRPGLEVWIVPPTLAGVRQTVVSEVIQDSSKRGLLIRLEQITNRTEAQELAGRYLLARTEPGYSAATAAAAAAGGQASSKARQAPGKEADAIPEDVPRVRFSDINYGELGTLLEVRDGPAYDIWVVAGPYGLLEIPAVDAYLLDEQANMIRLSLPKGFIEITTNNKGALAGED